MLEAEGGGLVENLRPVDQHLPRFALAQARDDLDKLGLAVAVDTGDADDLAPTDLEIQTLDDLNAAVVETVQILHVQHDLAGLLLGLVDCEGDLAADHHGG